MRSDVPSIPKSGDGSLSSSVGGGGGGGICRFLRGSAEAMMEFGNGQMR